MIETTSEIEHDVVVDFFPPKDIPHFAYALVKVTYDVSADGKCTPSEPVPLFHDFRDEQIQPRLRPGTDFWPNKTATDVAIQGCAFSPTGNPISSQLVVAKVGSRSKQIQVWGDRELLWDGGRPVIGPPEPYVEMPLTYELAYGGADRRVEAPQPTTPQELAILEFDHPGLYPRNPFGKGYVVAPDPIEGIQLPNLEDPAQPLAADNLIVGQPQLWHRQPLPWCYEWTYPLMFPRFAWLGLNAWFAPPENEKLAEVRHGWLPKDYRSRLGSDFDPERTVPWQYYQEASLGMYFEDLAPGTAFSVEGMHPEGRTVQFRLPEAPSIELELESVRSAVVPSLTNVLVQPAEDRVCLTYSGRLENMHRVFIPGVHRNIPLRAWVDGTPTAEYETPVPVRERGLQTGTNG